MEKWKDFSEQLRDFIGKLKLATVAETMSRQAPNTVNLDMPGYGVLRATVLEIHYSRFWGIGLANLLS